MPILDPTHLFFLGCGRDIVGKSIERCSELSSALRQDDRLDEQHALFVKYCQQHGIYPRIERFSLALVACKFLAHARMGCLSWKSNLLPAIMQFLIQ